MHAVRQVPAASLALFSTLSIILGLAASACSRAAPQVPAASLALFNTLSIILLIPVYDRGLVPLLRHFGTKLTLLSRIGAPPSALTTHDMHFSFELPCLLWQAVR